MVGPDPSGAACGPPPLFSGFCPHARVGWPLSLPFCADDCSHYCVCTTLCVPNLTWHSEDQDHQGERGEEPNQKFSRRNLIKLGLPFQHWSSGSISNGRQDSVHTGEWGQKWTRVHMGWALAAKAACAGDFGGFKDAGCEKSGGNWKLQVCLCVCVFKCACVHVRGQGANCLRCSCSPE